MSMLDIKQDKIILLKLKVIALWMARVYVAAYMYQDVLFNVKSVITKKHRILNMVKHFLKISCKKYLKIVPLVYFWNQYFGWRAFCNLNISLKIVRAFRERFATVKRFGYGLAFYSNIWNIKRMNDENYLNLLIYWLMDYLCISYTNPIYLIKALLTNVW